MSIFKDGCIEKYDGIVLPPDQDTHNRLKKVFNYFKNKFFSYYDNSMLVKNFDVTVEAMLYDLDRKNKDLLMIYNHFNMLFVEMKHFYRIEFTEDNFLQVSKI